MKDETLREIHFSFKDIMEARKSYPELYTDDRIIVMAISLASVMEPDAPVRDVYQAARTELIRCLAAEVPKCLKRRESCRASRSRWKMKSGSLMTMAKSESDASTTRAMGGTALGARSGTYKQISPETSSIPKNGASGRSRPRPRHRRQSTAARGRNGGRSMKRKPLSFLMRKYPGFCGAIVGVMLYVILTLLCRVLTDKPVLPCPNCGAPLQRDGTAYYCTEPHCGYHS